jgi:flavin reductase (DIM6/NTAB) family NADH-FMN oxidoreductase RutF
MTPEFRPIAPEEIPDNPFRLIGADWMLITAGRRDRFNTMTASWGGLGVLWNRPVCFCFVRPTRHTFGYLERGTAFTLSFFDERFRPALDLCGTRSGRDLDKAAAAGLTPVAGASGAVAFAEARLVLECRKLYGQDLDPARFADPAIANHYPARDYHRLFVGEITHTWIRTGG